LWGLNPNRNPSVALFFASNDGHLRDRVGVILCRAIRFTRFAAARFRMEKIMQDFASADSHRRRRAALDVPPPNVKIPSVSRRFVEATHAVTMFYIECNGPTSRTPP
jgi:hypothetical protein